MGQGVDNAWPSGQGRGGLPAGFMASN